MTKVNEGLGALKAALWSVRWHLARGCHRIGLGFDAIGKLLHEDALPAMYNEHVEREYRRQRARS